MKYLFYILSILLLGCNNNEKFEEKTDNLDSNPQQQVAIQKVKTTDDIKVVETAKIFNFKNPDIPFEDSLVLNTENRNYLITPLGLFFIANNDSIQLETELIVETAYLYEDKEHFYIFFTDTDHEGATSWIQKISKNPLSSEYVEQIQGFNLGQPIISQGFAFVTAIGFVGKIDLTTGKYLWKHHNLYDRTKYSFNSFDTVILKQNMVKFISNNYKSKKVDKVIINNKTGEIIEVEK
jgi:hypothetical protein